jgi:hypothetical protein
MDPHRRLDGEQSELKRWGVAWWLARLAFSFLILAFVVGYEGWKAHQRGDEGRAAIMLIGAAAGAALSLSGFRLRHRR